MKNLGLGCFSLKPLSFCRIWLIIFEYRGKAKHCRFWNPNKGKTLITPLILRCSPSSVLPLVPPNLPRATAMLWGSSYQSLCRSRSSWWGSDVLAIHAPCSLEDFLLWVCAFFFLSYWWGRRYKYVYKYVYKFLTIVCFVLFNVFVLFIHVTSASVLGHHLVF